MASKQHNYEQFHRLPDEACHERILAARARLGDRLLILGHHYQRDEVIRYADCKGDSLKLSRVASQSDAEYIVFCGVHFMAEVAAVIAKSHQKVILPDLAAGCSMADMASLANVERCWRDLESVLDADELVTPVVYINSAADVKAFCGRHHGIVCTSSNVEAICRVALSEREKILFMPDEHLGRWCGHKLQIPSEHIVTWDPQRPLGGLTAEQIRNAQVLLWKGFCSVHQMFKTEHISRFRTSYPDGKVIAHPECSFEVCSKADYVGSTEDIVDVIKRASNNTRWLVGTELNLVNRVAEEVKAEGKIVRFMAPTACMCSTMQRIDAQHLAWVLENLAENHVVNRIVVAPAEARYAKEAIRRMLDVSTRPSTS